MRLTINQETTVREEQRAGDRWLIAENAAIVQAQNLTNGYVPERSVQKSLSRENTHGGTGWGGVTVTLNHPRNAPEFAWYDPNHPTGEPVLAANDVVQETLGLGQLENAQWDGEFVRADVAVNADRATEMGGEATDVVVALENGDPLDVSTQYIGAELPPGEYDGEYREQAETIIAPDSLAVLPNRKGQCSVEDGCGVHADLATANGITVTLNAAPAPGDREQAEVTGNVTDDPAWSSLGGELSRLRDFLNQAIGSWRSLDEDQGGDGSLPEEPTPNADSMTKRALIDRAVSGNQFPNEWPFAPNESGVEECKERLAGEVADEDAFCFGWAGEAGVADNADHSGDSDDDEDGEPTANSNQTAGAESPVDADSTTDMKDRSTLIEEITANSAIERESLEGMGDQCLQAAHEHVVDNEEAESGDGDGNADDGDTETDSAETETSAEGDEQVVVADKAELESLIEERVEERVAANREQQRKRDRVETIVANSDEYGTEDTEELMDTPDGVLDRIERGLESGVQMPATTSPDVSAQSDADVEEFDAGVFD